MATMDRWPDPPSYRDPKGAIDQMKKELVAKDKTIQSLRLASVIFFILVCISGYLIHRRWPGRVVYIRTPQPVTEYNVIGAITLHGPDAPCGGGPVPIVNRIDMMQSDPNTRLLHPDGRTCVERRVPSDNGTHCEAVCLRPDDVMPALNL